MSKKQPSLRWSIRKEALEDTTTENLGVGGS